MSDKCKSCSSGFRYNACKLCCSSCGGLFHIECLGIEKAEYKTLVKDQSSWVCCGCADRGAVNSNSRAPALTPRDPDAFDVNTAECSLPNLMEQLILLRREQKEITKSLECSHQKLDEVNKKLDGQALLISSLQNKVDDLQSENITLKSKLSDLVAKMDEKEQYERRNTLEIRGIPQIHPNESPEQSLEIVKSIAKALDLQLENDSVDYCHRLKKPLDGRPAPIIVKFVRRFDKFRMLNQRRIKRNLSGRHLDLGLKSDDPIGIYQSLTPLRSRLRYLAAQKQKALGFKWLWVTPNGEIKMKKADNSPVYNIRDSQDLEALN